MQRRGESAAADLERASASNIEEAARLGEHAQSERCYVGQRSPAGFRVLVVDESGSHSLASRTRDPLWSFSWGRAGASARELAWSIIRDCSGDPQLADDWCGAFTAEVIARLPRNAFRIGSLDVLDWLHDDAVLAFRRAPTPLPVALPERWPAHRAVAAPSAPDRSGRAVPLVAAAL